MPLTLLPDGTLAGLATALTFNAPLQAYWTQSAGKPLFGCPEIKITSPPATALCKDLLLLLASAATQTSLAQWWNTVGRPIWAALQTVSRRRI